MEDKPVGDLIMDITEETRVKDNAPTRRRFAYAVIYGLGALIGAALAIPSTLYLVLPPKARKQQSWVEAGDLSQLQPGVPLEMTFRRIRADGWKIYSEKGTAWVVKTAEGKIIAFSPICTHLGCAYHWDATKAEFVCPCHGSDFAVDGRVLSGPAPRPLDRYEVKVENSRVWLGRVLQGRETES
jgi:menaquinol-cytochrome c reductase iron-sulfur subunit